MDDYAGQAGRLLADRYRLPQPPAEAHHLTESVAYDTASGQEVLVRRIPLPEVVDAEFVGGEPYGGAGSPGDARYGGPTGSATRRPADPAVRRAVEAAVAAARIPDHPRLDQVFDVFVEGDGLWIVSELLPATPLAALLRGQTLTAHRAAEIAADVLTALRTVHAHGWTHRNVTARTVLICDDGRALLTGLAVGAAEEALCGYNPLPDAGPAPLPPTGAIPGDPSLPAGADGEPGGEQGGLPGPARQVWTDPPLPEGFDARDDDGGGEGPSTTEVRAPGPEGAPPVRHGYGTGRREGPRGPRSDAIAAYQAGTRRGAAARAGEVRPGGGHDRPGDAAPDQNVRPGGRPAAEASLPGVSDTYLAPDDYVRWLPSGEDEVSPADLPGSRPPNSLPVRATWHSSGGDREDEVPAGEADSGTADASGDLVHAAEDDDYPLPPDPDDEDLRWDDGLAGEPGGDGRFRGPSTALEAGRARHARMTVVGAVSERWAPEQAGPVHENWRLAPPVGPAADLWALGVLLFRAVQGHPPYPEDDVAELVQMVCSEPPAFAEDCGPLRPVVESLLRQDPTERPEFEELRGWVRSLVRSAPEPEVGWHTVYAPSLEGGPSNPRRLPILRRRGELVRRRREERRAAAAGRRREKQSRKQAGRKRARPVPPAPEHGPAPAVAAPPAGSVPPHEAPPAREKPRRPAKQRGPGGPARLGRVLLGLVLLGLTGAVLYAMWFMPKDGSDGAADQQRGSVGGETRSAQPDGDGGRTGGSDAGGSDGGSGGEDGSEAPSDPGPAGRVPQGYKLSRDPAGFQVAVPQEWDRRSTPGRGQVRYNGGAVEMVVVNGRDSTGKYGRDPMAYQIDREPELAAYRASEWASTSGLRRIDVGARAMAEGTFTWRDGGRDVYARNRAMILDGRYHLLLVMGSKSEKAEIDRHFEAVADTYRATGR